METEDKKKEENRGDRDQRWRDFWQGFSEKSWVLGEHERTKRTGGKSGTEELRGISGD